MESSDLPLAIGLRACLQKERGKAIAGPILKALRLSPSIHNHGHSAIIIILPVVLFFHKRHMSLKPRADGRNGSLCIRA